jgi:hypothetical protein
VPDFSHLPAAKWLLAGQFDIWTNVCSGKAMIANKIEDVIRFFRLPHHVQRGHGLIVGAQSASSATSRRSINSSPSSGCRTCTSWATYLKAVAFYQAAVCSLRQRA